MSATEQEQTVVSVTVGTDGRVVIAAEVCDAAGLQPGDTIEIERVLHGILVVPVATEEEIEAFWGPNWRAELEESLANVAAGRTTYHDSDEEFLAALEARMHADA